jgi:hypothetical protein
LFFKKGIIMFKKLILSLCLSISLFSVHAAQPTLEETENSKTLIQAIKSIGGLSANGTQNPAMMSSALDFMQECATNFYCNKVEGFSSSERLGTDVMSNVGSKERFQSCPGGTYAEIIGSCTASNAQEASRIIIDQWIGNNVIMNHHDFYAYALVGTDKISGFAGRQWFAIGLFSDGVFAYEPAVLGVEAQPTNDADRNNALLVQAVKAIGGLSANGAQNANMVKIATDFAQECATNFYFNKVIGQPSSARLDNNMISHVGAEERFRSFPGRSREEILTCCTAYSAKEAATKLANQWFNSPGHKASMMPFHHHYAYALVRTDKIEGYAGYQWFAVGLFADN